MLFGLSLGGLYLYFRKNGRALPATIYGIERYQSRSNRKTSTYYRPLIKYSFKGKNYIFSSTFGSNEIRFRVGEKVKVYSLDIGPEYVRLKSKVQWLFPLIFFILGFIGSAIYFYKNPSTAFLAIFILFLTSLPFVSIQILKAKGLLDKFNKSALKVKLEDKESMNGREIFIEKKDLNQHIKKNRFVAFIITLIFSLASSTALHFSWKETKEGSKEYFFELIKNYELYTEMEVYIKDKNFLLSIILMLFTALLIYSLIFQVLRKK